LHDTDPAIYRTAVKALGVLGHCALPDLLGLFKSAESGTVRACCIKALVQISVNFPDQAFPSEVMVVLEEALDDENPVVAQSALMTLGHLSKQDVEQNRVIPLLIKACDRSNIAHVQGAAMALAELDSPVVYACLESLANDESKDTLIREVAQSSLERRKSLNLN
jgi:bilin biosynthesis protein